MTTKAVIMPIVVSKIRFRAKLTGLASACWVTVTHRKTTHIKNVPFSCPIQTENLIIGISRSDSTA